MIELDPSLCIGEGSHRATYRHPQEPGLCVKIVKAGSLEQRRRRNKKWYKRLRKLSAFDETHKDVAAYRRFGADPGKYRHLPRFHGMAQTSLGPGMLLDRVVNADGSPARTLADHLKTGANREGLRQALYDLRRNLIEQAIVVRDFALADVLVRENADGGFLLFIVDGLGGGEFACLSRIPFFARRKARRRVDRFFRLIMHKHPDFILGPE